MNEWDSRFRRETCKHSDPPDDIVDAIEAAKAIEKAKSMAKHRGQQGRHQAPAYYRQPHRAPLLVHWDWE